MIGEIEVRESLPADIASIEALYLDAFPDENLLPLVRALLGEESTALSLVAMADKTLVGHVVFTPCSIAGSPGEVVLLGPLAVASDRQGRGIGSALVREGFKHLKSVGATQAQVLGDPAYYRRFGFEPDDGVTPPYPLPEEWRGAWQSIRLRDDKPPLHGSLCVPQPWRQAALWSP